MRQCFCTEFYNFPMSPSHCPENDQNLKKHICHMWSPKKYILKTANVYDTNTQQNWGVICGIKRFFKISNQPKCPKLSHPKPLTLMLSNLRAAGGWFGVAVRAFVISMKLNKLSYVKPGQCWDWWRPLVGLPFIQATHAHSAWPSLRGWIQWVVPEMVLAISGKKWRLWSYELMALYKSVYQYKF